MDFVGVEYHEEWLSSVVTQREHLRCTLRLLDGSAQLGCTDDLGQLHDTPNVRHFVTRRARHMIFDALYTSLGA